MMTDKQFLSEYRRQGRDFGFANYLLGRRVRIFGAVIMRDLVAPWATPVCNWLVRTRG